MGDAGSPILLEYGRERRPRWWRRGLRGAIVVALLAIVVTAGVYGFRRAALWFDRRAGYRTVAAWYEQARATTLPAGTLLYSEDPADAARPGGTRIWGIGGRPTAYAFASAHPTLRVVRYRTGGVPMLGDHDILYAHEHALWDVPVGSKPAVLCVAYRGLTATGHLEFFVTSYRVNPNADALRFPFMGSTTRADGPPGRSLARLRIFAGVPHPTDARRFAIPFDCDGGRGRFEFRTDDDDDDVTDGGQLEPKVWIEWDDGAATRPTLPEVR